MPGGQPLRLGPFIGGLNTGSDPTAIADAELSMCENFELDIDGSLVSRPPLEEIAGKSDWTERIILLTEGVFSGAHYLIGTNADGVFYGLSGVWTLITNTFEAGAALQFGGKIYMVPKPGSANPGGKWDPVGGYTAVAAIPQGQAAVIHKNRMFIAPGIESSTNESRLRFSDAGNLDVWDAANFIDAGQGDGTKLVDLTVFQDNLLLFKEQATYLLAYDIRPTDAVLREISSTIGAAGQFNVANYENQVYVFHNGWVYEIINYDFNRLNTKVPFERDDTTPTPFDSVTIFLSILEDRLICRYYRNIYSFNIRTRTWAVWESIADPLQYFGPIVPLRPSTGTEYYAGSIVTAFRTVIKLYNKPTSLTRERTLDPFFNTDIDLFTRTVSDGWGTSTNSLAWSIVSGAATPADFSVDGTRGVVSVSAVNSARDLSLPVNLANFDIKGTISPAVLATGASALSAFYFRSASLTDTYRLRVEFKTTGVCSILMEKIVAGVATTIAASVDITGSYVANDILYYRVQAIGTSLKAKVWRSSILEPISWMLTATDSAHSAAGSIMFRSFLFSGNTNALPVLFRYDNIVYGDPSDLDHVISCSIRTKNFDMAISHQFKRLWWWGADVTTDNDVIGIATPISISFNVTWGALNLGNVQWGQLLTWERPQSAINSINTVVATETGTQRRFVKFLKSLRYRQIHFEVQLTTEGSTNDGPARIFTILIVTESKQAVPKSVN